VGTFIEKLDPETKSHLLSERIRQGVSESSPGALRWHLDAATLADYSVSLKRKHAAEGLNQIRQEVLSLMSAGNQAMGQRFMAMQGEVSNAQMPPTPEQDLAGQLSHMPAYEAEDDSTAAHELLAFVRQNHTRYFPRAGQQMRPGGGGQRSQQPPPPPSGKPPDPVADMRRKNGDCMICGAQGPDKGGHWARQCPMRETHGKQAAVDSLKQMAACYPEQDEHFQALLQHMEDKPIF
jgi:hypothetical protein